MEVFDEFDKDSTFEKVHIFGSVVRTVSKEVFFGGMPVKIEVKLKALEVFLSDFKRQLMEPGDLGEDKAVEVFELAVEVFARVRSSIIADNNTVDVDHGDDVKDEHFSEDFVFGVLLEQLQDDALHDMRRVRLTGVDSG